VQAQALLSVADLPVHVAELHHIMVNQAQPTNTRSCQVQRCRRAQAPAAYNQHAAAAQPALRSDAKAGQQQLSAVALYVHLG
jgi:hypothetical protein